MIVATPYCTSQGDVLSHAHPVAKATGSNLGKVLSKLRIVADQNAGGSLQIRWSDNDYKDWTNWITINLQDDVPFLTNLGRFTKRAFQYRHSSATPFRMAAFEVDLLLGSI